MIYIYIYIYVYVSYNKLRAVNWRQHCPLLPLAWLVYHQMRAGNWGEEPQTRYGYCVINIINNNCEVKCEMSYFAMTYSIIVYT